MPVMVVGALDRALSWHLVRAIAEHQRWCRTNAVPVPPELDELLNAALVARDGQRRPGVEVIADGREDESMLLTLNYEAAGRRLSVSDRTVRRMVADGRLPTVTVGGAPRIRAADLVSYVESLEDR